jgi:membrane protein YdbS with pleckstrin-like domain
MLFNKNESKVNDRVLYQTKPNMILGCKKAIYGVILLGIILYVSPMAIHFIGEMQVYLISHIKLSLTRYAAIAFFVVILINVIYIIWQLIGWSSIEYTLTESKIIVKSGVISTKKNYMPYGAIQDLNTSQSIFAKLLNVGSVSVFSAYDSNLLELKNISNPSEVEEIIFSRMVGQPSFQNPPQSFPQQPGQDRGLNSRDDYLGRNDYYDEYEPITPITHERNVSPRREYEYYPEDFVVSEGPQHRYEYEPYGNGMNGSPNRPPQDNYYNQPMDDYSYGGNSHHQNNDSQNYYNETSNENSQNNQDDVDGSKEAIKRHFDKFKK